MTYSILYIINKFSVLDELILVTDLFMVMTKKELLCKNALKPKLHN